MYGNGNLEQAAAQIPQLMTQFDDPEDRDKYIIHNAAVTLAKDPNFTKELFDGDARPLIEAAIEKARERWS